MGFSGENETLSDLRLSGNLHRPTHKTGLRQKAQKQNIFEFRICFHFSYKKCLLLPLFFFFFFLIFSSFFSPSFSPALPSRSSSLEAFKAINYTTRTPLGVAGLITPWNLPLYLLTWKVCMNRNKKKKRKKKNNINQTTLPLRQFIEIRFNNNSHYKNAFVIPVNNESALIAIHNDSNLDPPSFSIKLPFLIHCISSLLAADRACTCHGQHGGGQAQRDDVRHW